MGGIYYYCSVQSFIMGKDDVNELYVNESEEDKNHE